MAYEIPHVGGRAQGKRRPRAPSLSERPNGRARTFNIGGAIATGSLGEERAPMSRRPIDST